jgi:hypothetical protein
MRTIHVAVLTAVTLSGCAKHDESKVYRDEKLDVVALAPPPAPPVEPAAADASVAPAVMAPAQKPAPQVRPLGPMLAYSYTYSVDAPAAKLASLQSLHERACAAAGAPTCQVVNQSLLEGRGGAMGGTLSLRATPAWLQHFRDGLANQARAAGGKVLRSTAESEDLTRDIVDGEASLRAQTTLRDRLQNLLATHPGKVSELLEVERELARVQSEIDTGQSELKVAQDRVVMSQVTIDYTALNAIAVRSAWSPLASAFGEFGAVLASGLAAMVTIVAVLLPWALAIGLALFLLRRPLRRLASRRPSWARA